MNPSEITFAPAVKRQMKARLALCGPPGSGKTFSALAIGSGLGDRVAVLDSERASAALYSDIFTFLHKPITRFEPAQLPAYLTAAADQHIDVLIIDSLSHWWMGAGGMLEQVDALAKRSGGTSPFGGWRDASPVERHMWDALLDYPGHLITTLRTHTEYVIEENDKGRKAPRKIGLAPVQRKGLEYEFQIVGDLDHTHTLTVTKSRCPSLADRIIPQPDAAMAAEMLTWLGHGAAGRGAEQIRADAIAATDPGTLRALFAEACRDDLGYEMVIDPAGGEPIDLVELIRRRGRSLTGQPGDDTAGDDTAGDDTAGDDTASERSAPAAREGE